MNEHNGKSKLKLESIEENMMAIFNKYNVTTAKHIIWLQGVIILFTAVLIFCVLFLGLEKGLKPANDTLNVYAGYLFALLLLVISFILPEKISGHKVIRHFLPLCWLLGLFIPSGILLSSIASKYGLGGNTAINNFLVFLGLFGAVASIAAIYHSYLSEKRLEEKLDLRILNLNQKDCFSKLTSMLNSGDQKSCNELGRPPRKHIAIVNRNSLIPGFWVDPLYFHDTDWKGLIRAIYNSVSASDKDKDFKLELYVPIPYSFKADDFSLKLRQDMEQISQDSKNLVIITNKDNSLHFCIFDNNRDKVVDKYESELSDQSDVDVIGNLKEQLKSLWNNGEIKREVELQIIDDVISITCHTYFNNYFSVIKKLAEKNANKIIDRAFGELTIKKNEFRNKFIKGNIYLCVKQLPNFLNDHTVTNGEFSKGKHNTILDIKTECNDSCNYYKHCSNKDNLINCLIMQYCEYVEHLFIHLKYYASNLSFTDNPVDEKINFPLLIFFDSKTLRSENDRSKVAMIMMHKNVIEDGKFNSHILFPWAIVNGLMESIDHTKEDDPKKDSANICSNIVRAHEEHRLKIMKNLKL